MKGIPEELILSGQHFNRAQLLEYARMLVEAEEVEWKQSLGQFIIHWLDNRSFVEIMTSGSTGIPKNIRLSKEAMVASASLTGRFFDLLPDQQALLCLRVNYIAGLMMVVRAMVHRMNLIAVPPTNSPLEFIPDNTTIHFAAMLPVQVMNALESEELKSKLEAINTIIVGGAPVSPSLEAGIRNLNNRVFATYGMTETITHIAVRRMSGKESSQEFTLLPGITISTDKRGCLIAKVPYLNNHPVVTNDVIRPGSSGKFRWLGRFDNVINSGGLKLFPEMIEQKIAPLISHRFFISSVTDDKLGEVPVLVVEKSELLCKEYLDELNKKMAKLLRKTELPRQIYCTSTFHEGENGKINRKMTMKTLL
ncbi:MAG: AMP-binding protein [Lentimicrobium sp.]|jgi:O-succinylbenzoic acid--CoA ligase|nr:AMP-binding protein [Lentimicrobium sp.]MDD2527257.1 AMP-binding protein [Lentimicrobiaceae bacterium]MDD4596563.1 AMP-binding protein [Lentimicrobiaceae bacterium]MDY0024858.1 AMP-binding protein [Lentimicrobium sp.]HAH56849.1 O-succinylbenzoic acid--CoA ligase [Bacteroidales bacterium]